MAVLTSPWGPEVAQALANNGGLEQVKTRILNFQASYPMQPYLQEQTNDSLATLAAVKRK